MPNGQSKWLNKFSAIYQVSKKSFPLYNIIYHVAVICLKSLTGKHCKRLKALLFLLHDNRRKCVSGKIYYSCSILHPIKADCPI
jgi:hypothetical protein